MTVTTSMIAWIAIATSFLVTFGNWIDPANTETPGNWSASARSAAFAIVSFLVGIGHAVTVDPSTPVTQSILVAMMTLGPSLLAHFSPKLGALFGKGAARGFIHFEVKALLALSGFLAFAGMVTAGCDAQKMPKTQADEDAALRCLVTYGSEAASSGEMPLAIVESLAAQCGLPVAQVLFDLATDDKTILPAGSRVAVASYYSKQSLLKAGLRK